MVIREITGTVLGKIEFFFLLSFDGFLKLIQLRIGCSVLFDNLDYSSIEVRNYMTEHLRTCFMLL